MTFSRRKWFSYRSFAGFVVGLSIGFLFGWINLSLVGQQIKVNTLRHNQVIDRKQAYDRTFNKKPCTKPKSTADNMISQLNLNQQNKQLQLSSNINNFHDTIVGRQKKFDGDENENLDLSKSTLSDQSNRLDLKTSKDHSNDKGFLYIGVLTAKKYLPTRGQAIYDTWAKSVPGKVQFYVGGAGGQNRNEDDMLSKHLPIVRLSTVDDNAYPPQKKSFMLLKDMYDHYLAGYQWFMRADDDIYLKPERLESFLRKLNSSEEIYLGQMGMGNEEERGKLSLNYGENYCMGGPGMIFSREVIRKVVPHIKYCLQHLYTWHEDVEISRCVRKFAGVNCVWSYEMKDLFYEHYSIRKGYIDPEDHSDSLLNIERAITLHPNKKPEYQRKLHLYMLKKHVTSKLSKIRNLNRDVINMDSLTGQPSDLEEFMHGIQPSLRRYVPQKSNDVQTWDFFSNYYFMTRGGPRRGMPKHVATAAKGIVMSIMLDLNSKSMARGRVIEFQKITYGYRRVNPLFGAEYVLDILLRYNRYRGKKVVIPVRRHAYLQQTFAKTILSEEADLKQNIIRKYLRQMQPSIIDTLLKKPASAFVNLFNFKEQNVYIDGEETGAIVPFHQSHLSISDLVSWSKQTQNSPHSNSVPVNVIVPLTGRFDTFRKFMKNLEEIAWKRGDPVNVLIMLFMAGSESRSDMHLTQLLIQDYGDRYPEREIRFIPVAGEFSRGLALEIGAAQYSNNSLLFLCDVDVVFNSTFINRCRTNTVLGKSVYYPILFSQFRTASTTTSVKHDPYLMDKNFGYWRNFGYGLLCVYQEDFASTGGYDTSIQGWGLEDVDLFSKFVSPLLNIEPEKSKKKVTARPMRVEDPGLIHVYHTVHCDKNLQESRYKMCMSSRASGIRSTWDLANEWNVQQRQLTYEKNTNNIDESKDFLLQNDIVFQHSEQKKILNNKKIKKRSISLENR